MKEVFGDSVSVLKLGMVNPLPVKLILDFASKVDKLVVVEELDSIIEDHCRKLGLKVWGKNVLPLEGEFSQNLVASIKALIKCLIGLNSLYLLLFTLKLLYHVKAFCQLKFLHFP